jgi:integrase/recombinase XerD
VVQKYSTAVGLVDVKPHDFRRFVGTQLAKEDIRQAQKALGHKRIDTTAAHYVLDELEPSLTDICIDEAMKRKPGLAIAR